MSKLRKIVNDLFLIEKETSRENLKIFYTVDINIKNPNNQLPPQPIVNTSNVEQQAEQNVQQQKTESYRDRIKSILNEEDPLPVQQDPAPVGADFIKKTSGVFSVSKDEISNLQTLEDILDFVSDKKEKSGTSVFDDVTVELILAMAGINTTPLDQLIKKDDKVLVELNYGKKLDDSVGFKLLKRSGANNVSIVMLKNNEILDGAFDLKVFNSQIILFRNTVMGK